MKFYLLRFVALLVTLFLFPEVNYAQLVINEVSPKNVAGLKDEENDAQDWIELYNSGTSELNLSGYKISDGKSVYSLPNQEISPGEFLIILASGKNRNSYYIHSNFKLSKGEIVTLYSVQNSILDQVSIKDVQLNHSIARNVDGSGTFYLTNIVSPGQSNTSSAFYSGYVPNPELSLKSGYYSSSIKLTLYAQNGDSIYYTTNGKEPDRNSDLYTLPITLATTTVIKARAFNNSKNLLPSSVVTNTYIINYRCNLPVVSISTNPENLWDYNQGILAMGAGADTTPPYHGANFWKDLEIPVHIEYFDRNHKLGFEQDMGCKIHGGAQNRSQPMKSFRILAKKEYGKGKLTYPLFQDKPIKEYERFVLRNGSLDFNRAQMRDGIAQKILHKEHLNIDLLDYEPCVVLLNGEFYGIEDIREKIDKHYISYNYPGTNKQNLDLLKEDSTVIEGDFTFFNSMYEFIIHHDLSKPEAIDSVETMLDIPSLFDYFIAQTALENSDWPYNNIKFWRERKPGSKFRYVMFDLDGTFGTPWSVWDVDNLGRLFGAYGDNNRHVRLFRALLTNPYWRNYFINRYADLLNTSLSETVLTSYLSQNITQLKPVMPQHCEKWGYSTSYWESELNNHLLPFAQYRTRYNRNFVQENFNLKSQRELTLLVWPPQSGTISLNTLKKLGDNWNGIYFTGNSIHLQAIPNDGFNFVEWKGYNVVKEAVYQDSLSINLDTNEVLIAYFESQNQSQRLSVQPNPAKSKVYISLMEEVPATEIVVQLYSAEGRLVKDLHQVSPVSGLNLFEINTEMVANGIYIVKVKDDLGTYVSKLLIVHE